MKNENGQEKSAILKGQTLVNLFNVDNSLSLENANSRWKYQNRILNLIGGKKYYVYFFNKLNNSPLHIKPLNTLGEKDAFNVEANTGKVVTLDSTITNAFAYYYFKDGWTGEESKQDIIDNCKILFLEYQDGMENWNIPYFEGMQSVENPSLMTVGKNLFDGELMLGNVSGSNGIDLNSNQMCRTNYIKVTPGSDFTASIEGNYVVEKISEVDKDKNFIKTTEKNIPSISVTLTNSTSFIRCVFKHINNPNEFSLDEVRESKIQLEESPIATPYEPFKSNILTVNEDVTLRGIGDVQDTLDCLTGELTQCVEEVVLNGQEKWRLCSSSYQPTDTNYISYDLDVNNIKTSAPILCDTIKVRDWTISSTEINSRSIAVHSTNQVLRLCIEKAIAPDVESLKTYLSTNMAKVQYQLATESIKTVDLSIQDQDNQPQERMKLFPNGHINTSSSTIPPTLELKGVTYNNKLNMTTTNGTNNTQLATLDNLVLDGIICRDGTIVRDSYDVESGLYTKRVFRFTIDEEFVEKYRNSWLFGSSNASFEPYLPQASTGLPKPPSYTVGVANNMIYKSGGDINRVNISTGGAVYITILKEEVPSYDVDGLLDWIKRNGAIEIAYQMATPQTIHMQPNMTPYVSTRPYQGSIESQGNILESSFLDYTSEQSIISPKPLGDGDVLRWEQGSQCYVYENDKEYIPLTNYNQPMGTVLDLEEEDGEQFVENLDGGDIIVDVPFKEKAVYERHLVQHEDNVIYPTQDKLDPTGKIEVDYICGATWQNPNDLSDIRHVGTLREDGQYDVTIRRSGDDEIRFMDGTTHLSLDGNGINPSEFELTFFNKGGVEVGKYGDISHTLEDCVLDSKLETGTVYGDTLVNLVDTSKFTDKTTARVSRDSDGWITINGLSGSYTYAYIKKMQNLKPDTLYTIIIDIAENTLPGNMEFIQNNSNSYSFSRFTQTYYIPSKKIGRIMITRTTKNQDVFDNYVENFDFRIQLNTTNTGKIKFRFMVLEGDYTSYPTEIPYFEGVGSTIVNGFTVSNSDDTEIVKYTLPTPITLNKVGDIVDTYDVVSGVETRNVAMIVPQANLRFTQNDEFVGIAYTLATEERIESSGTIFETTSINTLGIPFINSNLVDGSGNIYGTSEGIGRYNTTELKIILAKSRLNLPEYTKDTVNQWLKENLVCYIKKYTPKTIQHTLIPSTVEMMQEPTFILPQPLRSVPNGICDRLYWDENKGHYCIEKRIGVEVFDGVNNFNLDVNDGQLKDRFNLPLNNIFYVTNAILHYYTNSNIFPQLTYNEEYNGKPGLALYNNGNVYFRYSSSITNAQFKQILSDNPVYVYYPVNNPEIIDLPHLNKKLILPTQLDTLPIGYKVENTKANPQLGLTIPYKQLNYPSRPQNIDFKMDIADYVLTWDDVKEARQYNVILNDRVIATVKEPQWNSGEEMYGYIMVEAQNELAENLSEELYIKTVPNAPAQLTVAHNPMTDYYDFEISFIKTSAIAEYYTVQYRIDGGEWVYKTIQSDEIDPNSKVLWRFSVYEINEQIEVWATATNEVGTNDILPIATYYMSPIPQWTYRVNSKELFVRWMDDSPYDTQYKLRYQYKSDGIFRYAYFEGDKQEIGKLYEALIPLADDEEVSIALCVISEKENLYTKPIKASKELDPNIKPPKNFNYRWISRGLIEFYWEDNYDVDVQYEAIVEHRMSGETTWTQDTRIFDSTDVNGVGTVYRLQYQLEELEEIRVKVRMKWAMNETEWTESLTTVFIPVEGNPPQWIRRTQTQQGLLVEWEPQQYVDSYHVYVMSNGEELQHLETQDNFILVDLDYSNTIDIEIYEVSRFTGGVESDPSDRMNFRPTMDKHQLIHDVVTPDTLTYEIEVDTVQRAIKERQVIHDINTTPKVTSKQPMDVAISSPFTLSFHPLQLDVHQVGAKYYGDTELHIKTLDVKSRDAIEVLSFERVTDQYGVDFTVYTPSASKYPITLEVNRVRIVCFGDSLTSGGKYYQFGNMDNRLVG